jgi:hypothetical protein
MAAQSELCAQRACAGVAWAAVRYGGDVGVPVRARRHPAHVRQAKKAEFSQAPLLVQSGMAGGLRML